MIIYDRVGNGKIILKWVIPSWINIQKRGTLKVGNSNEKTNKNISFTWKCNIFLPLKGENFKIISSVLQPKPGTRYTKNNSFFC